MIFLVMLFYFIFRYREYSNKSCGSFEGTQCSGRKHYSLQFILHSLCLSVCHNDLPKGTVISSAPYFFPSSSLYQFWISFFTDDNFNFRSSHSCSKSFWPKIFWHRLGGFFSAPRNNNMPSYEDYQNVITWLS